MYDDRDYWFYHVGNNAEWPPNSSTSSVSSETHLIFVGFFCRKLLLNHTEEKNYKNYIFSKQLKSNKTREVIVHQYWGIPQDTNYSTIKVYGVVVLICKAWIRIGNASKANTRFVTYLISKAMYMFKSCAMWNVIILTIDSLAFQSLVHTLFFWLSFPVV